MFLGQPLGYLPNHLPWALLNHIPGDSGTLAIHATGYDAIMLKGQPRNRFIWKYVMKSGFSSCCPLPRYLPDEDNKKEIGKSKCQALLLERRRKPGIFACIENNYCVSGQNRYGVP